MTWRQDAHFDGIDDPRTPDDIKAWAEEEDDSADLDERTDAGQYAGCGHVCCADPTDPHHDHFIDATDCVTCAAGRSRRLLNNVLAELGASLKRIRRTLSDVDASDPEEVGLVLDAVCADLDDLIDGASDVT